MRTAVTFVAAICVAALALGQDAASQPNATDRYVFYLHGRIIEDGEPRPVHDVWGLYDYPAVVRALEARGAVVISEQRSKDADIGEYAEEVRGQIAALVDAGVPQSQISVVGFSKGGAIAITVSGSMGKQYSDIRYVFLAACTDWVLEQSELSLTGHVLSISEASDDSTASCHGLSEHARDLESRSEITIDTGAGHGAFYLPREVWIEPTLQWVHGT